MTPPILDVRKDEPAFDLRDAMRRTRRLTGKPITAQALEIWRLHRSIGRLSAREYYYFRLYDDDRFTREEKRRFLGKAAQDRVFARCTDRRWWALAHDKLAFHAFMHAHGFPVPRLTATYHPYRSLAPAPALHSADDLATFLRTRAEYPFFSKPFTGMFSLGTARVDGRTVIVEM